MLTIERSLNIYAAGIPQIISLSQYDDDFQLVFTLYTSEGEFTIPSGTTAEVMGTKVDGNGYSASASISGSTVTVTGNKQMTACAGRNVYEIVLTKSGKRLATVNFILKVERAALDADTIQSETVLKELNAIIDSAETSTQAAAEAAASAAAAAESARTLTIDPTLTQSGQAADAKAVGDEISGLKEDISQIKPGLSDEAKTALLACFAKVAWIDEHGQDYYDALYESLYEEPPTPVPTFSYGVYEPDSVINGKYVNDTGEIVDGVANKSFYIEDFIPVIRPTYWIGYQPPEILLNEQDKYMGGQSNWRISEYNENKQFIKQTHYSAASDEENRSSAIITFDSNTKYIRLGWYYNSATEGSPIVHAFDIENPSRITEMPMESGDIDATTGGNITQIKRIRTIDYLPVVKNTITVLGCPFAQSWSDVSSVALYAVRCYDSEKNFLNSIAVSPGRDLENESLPQGTAYIRFIMQLSNYSARSYKQLVGYLFDVNGTKYFLK